MIVHLQIETPSRLHFSLIDLNGDLGRINGSLGVALDFPRWKIDGFLNNRNILMTNSKYESSVKQIIKNLGKKSIKSEKGITINISEEIPSHSGLGSTTQFSLAIGTLITKLNNYNIKTQELATYVKRGGTSGIGVGAFEGGGIILDGGHSFGVNQQTTAFLPSSKSNAPPPPILFRHFPPDNWRFIIIVPNRIKGLSGKKEIDLFKQHCPIPKEDVEKLCRLILMKILPAIVEGNIKIFGEGLTDIQTKFSRFGMEKYDNSIVAEVLTFLRKNPNIYSTGISSFGPTIYALSNSVDEINATINYLKSSFGPSKFKLLLSSNINRTGAKISHI